MDIKPFFINEFGRLRSGWRFAVFLISFLMTVSFLLAVAVFALTQADGGFNAQDSRLFFLQMTIFAAAAVFFGWLYGRIFENLPFRALGCSLTKNWLKDLIAGFALGAFSFAFAAFITFILGGEKFQFNRDVDSSVILTTLLTSLGVFTLGAMMEELLFRGYLLQTLARSKLAWLAILLTSAFFASAHLGNKSANFISTLNTALAGIWLGAAYLKTRNLWFPFGIHLAWNWFQGAIFGIEVSGIKEFTTAPLLQEIDAGPAWLTGENYGIEGGIACTVALIFSIALIYFLPNLKPTEELLALTSEEKPVQERLA